MAKVSFLAYIHLATVESIFLGFLGFYDILMTFLQGNGKNSSGGLFGTRI